MDGYELRGTVISIDQDRYLELLQKEEKLTALENGGVDSWEWYWEAVKHLYEDD